ncbi:hypothetical protein PO377_03160 [Atlantibacter hermannii]|uniref:capsular polysaccharide export protein, LipB/KpsS family n=1 Tax=Atlantibacter hermannii TaxID=565 RepID=UPI002FF952FB
MLTIITPVYCQSPNDHIYERTLFFIRNSFVSDDINRIIVDFGSLSFISSEFRSECNKVGIEYYNIGLSGNPFSAGECRNFGVSKATTEYVTFQDIDLYAPPFIYNKILERINSFEYYNEVECIPCLYLTEGFSLEYIDNLHNEEMHLLAYKKYKEKNEDIKLYAPVTSMILIKRTYLMECGGNNTEFYGHGYEDFELLNRIANRSNKFVRSRDYYNHDYKYDCPYYNGYRTYFSLFGREAMNDAVFFVHLWHPENISASYTARNQSNRNIFNKLIRRFDKDLYLPGVISGRSKELTGKTLILAPKNGKTVNSIRIAIPFLSECVFAKDNDFDDIESFAEYVISNEIKRVLFFNSFGNDFRKKLFLKTKELKLAAINYDRGGLPDTWFFDPNGFNASSSSYLPIHWDKYLNSEQTRWVKEYILKTLSSNETLEKNGERIGSLNFKKKYNVSNKKILFVPLQRPGDSVIKHFSSEIGSVETFFEEVLNLAKNTTLKDWVILVKKHPLESDEMLKKYHLTENVIILNENENFCDAIIASDAVMLINSGVGLYSLMAGKPTFNLGEAYYSHEGLSKKLSKPSDFISFIDNLPEPNVDKVEKFISYLMNEFYSLGQTFYKEVKDIKTNSVTNNAVYTDFTVLRIPNDSNELVTYKINRRLEPYKINSSYYEYYRSGILLRDKIITVEAKQSQKQSKGIDAKALDNKNSNILIEPSQTKVILSNNSLSINEKKIKTSNKLNRKVKKLIKHPVMFFTDAFRNKL